jgi:hypothetical protein
MINFGFNVGSKFANGPSVVDVIIYQRYLGVHKFLPRISMVSERRILKKVTYHRWYSPIGPKLLVRQERN